MKIRVSFDLNKTQIDMSLIHKLELVYRRFYSSELNKNSKERVRAGDWSSLSKKMETTVGEMV